MKISKLGQIRKRAIEVLNPPPDMEIYEWMNKHMVLSVENSSSQGRYSWQRTPYVKGWCDAVKNPRTEEIVVQAPAQVGKSAFLNGVIGYHASEEACPMLLALPELKTAKKYSKDKITPLIRDSKLLSSLIGGVKEGNSEFFKHFKTGAQLTLVGCNSPSDLSSMSIRIVMVDEISRVADDVGGEGDPVEIAKKRMATFSNRKFIATSTPTVKGSCQISNLYGSDLTRRHEYEVPCPHCGAYIVLDFDHFHWESGLPSTAHYKCQKCKGEIRDSHKSKYLRLGRWKCINPDVGEWRMGFRLNALYSPWTRFEALARSYELALKDERKMISFINTMKALPYEPKTTGIEFHNIYNRREEYPKGVDVPAGGLVLTAGCDVQLDRIEVETVAWGKNQESWSVDYSVLWGNTTQPEVWQMLSDHLKREYVFEWGMRQKVTSACIDSGYQTSMVSNFVANQPKGSRIFMTKGMGGHARPMVSAPVIKRTGRSKARVPLFTLGTYELKYWFYDKIKIEKGKPGYCHFPKRATYDRRHFKQLVAERTRIVVKKSYPEEEWYLPSDIRSCEQLDCRLYAYAAYIILNPHLPSIEKRLLQYKNAQEAGEEAAKGKKKTRISPEEARQRKGPKIKVTGSGNKFSAWWR